MFWWILTSRAALDRWRGPGVLGLLLGELSLNFLVPSFYIINTLPRTSLNPYVGAPYIDFLKQENKGHWRIFARGGLLYPNWASAFKISDIRSLDAIEYRPYVDFIRNFLLKPGDETRLDGELADRFTGTDTLYQYDFTTNQERRLLELSSVKYVLSTTELGRTSHVVDEIIDQHQGEKIQGFGRAPFPIDNHHIAIGLFQHPPSGPITYRTTIAPDSPTLIGVLALQEAVHDKSDGAGFTIAIEVGNQTEVLFHGELNPRDVPADRGGRPFAVDLTRYAGRQVELLFSTDAGPNGDNAYDWAGWAGLDFVAPASTTANDRSDQHRFFREIYNAEIEIYEVKPVLPRAALYSAAEILPTDQILSRLRADSFDPERTVVLSRESIPTQDAAALASVVEATAAPVQSARIMSYEPRRVRIEADTEASMLLMLNDTDYPGWHAFVNGKPAPILRADYLFRAVLLPPGKNVVEFDYEPMSFRIGAAISGASVTMIFALALRRRSCNRKRKANLT